MHMSPGTEGYSGGTFSVVVPQMGCVQDEADGSSHISEHSCGATFVPLVSAILNIPLALSLPFKHTSPSLYDLQNQRKKRT